MHFLSQYIPVADAITALFYPNVEVVIHDIAEDVVFYISNPVSGRKSGDISLLGLEDSDLHDGEPVIGPYEKAGEKGQRIRATTAVLKNEAGKAVGLLCINLDFSAYESALDLIESLIRPPRAMEHPQILFQNDWRDQIKLEIRAFLEAENLLLDNLAPAQRKKLIALIDGKNLFFAKKSIEQVAAMLGVSRATAYNDLKAARQKNKPDETKGR